jgi:hypothetical protein
MQLRVKKIDLNELTTLLRLVGVLLSCIVGSPAWSQDKATQSELIQQIGIQNHWKLGHSCNVRLEIPSDLKNTADAVSITTLDGDGVEVVYRIKLENSNSGIVDVPVRIGQQNSVLSATISDQKGQTLATHDLDLAGTQGLSATQPLVLCLGDSMGLEDLVADRMDTEQQNLRIANVTDAQALPTSWLTYQQCNLVVISTSEVDLLREVTSQQWDALDRWIRRGGGCILSLGGKAADIQSIEGLMKLMPGRVLDDAIIRSPAALESMIITEQQLQPFPAVQIAVQRGQIQLGLKDSLSRQLPWWVSAAHGHGSIEVIASNLSHKSFADWTQRKALWERIVQSYLDKSAIEGSQKDASATTSYLGYSDLSGQLRASLDQFDGVTSVSFGQVAAVLLVILLLIGPIDYFISVKYLKRPDLSWPLAGAMLIASCSGLAWYYHKLRPDQVVINTVQIVDVDTQSGQVDGHLWSHVYSAHARPLNISANSKSEHVFLEWQGLPGKGLGGLQSQLSVITGLPTYSINILPDQSTRIEGVGVLAAGTKSLYGTYSYDSQPATSSSLRELSTVDQLEGELINPLDVDLRDVSLYYRSWHYSLSSRLPAGEMFKLSAQILPKDLARKLNKQQQIDGKTSAARWDPGERNQIDRLMELMMFHRAATGSNYTSLTNSYQPIVDHSKLLESNFAILVGRLDAAPVQLQVEPTEKSDNPAVTTAFERTWCRIIIPVQSGRKPIDP